jgi:SAM-dependent methyltransferase
MRYSDIGWREVSWFQEIPEPSTSLVTKYAKKNEPIVDVGGGASLLVDALIADGFTNVTVVDLSSAAIATAQERVNNSNATFIAVDICEWVPSQQFTAWHDRAAYHFLTDTKDQQHYWDSVRTHLKPGGTLIIATFAEDGPEMCSGLPIQRYSPEELIEAMGEGFEVIETKRHTHVTPSGGEQKFVWVNAQRTS